MYDNKFKKMMSDYATKTGKSVDALTEEDYRKIIYENAGQSFIDECLLLERKELLNPMFKRAQDILFKAYLSTDEEKVKELAKLAYKTSPECLDALNIWYNLEDDQNKKLDILDEGIRYEEAKLNRLGYFDNEYKGKFYEELETRNYLRILRNKLDVLLFVGRFGIAKKLCLDILNLNKNDDLRVRYVLLGIYAYFEDEKSLMELEDNINENSLETLMPLLVLYYKLDQMDMVDECLLKIRNISSDFIPFFQKYLADCKGNGISFQTDFSEDILSVMNNISFLINATPGLVFYLGMLE